ncbi:hypothetical protein ONZ45_g19604 [Pleurotus djamor]|nr:hypothetical protein ONZ45_g19604 [Pleurotus djamor]
MNTLPTQDRLPILYQRFLKNVRAIPTSLAVIDDASGTKLTYAELLDDASKLAARLVLATPDLQPEEPICILMPRCVGQVLAQLAVLQCNACCVPIDPEIPLQRQEAMMERLRVRVVLLLDSEAPSGIRVQPRRIESTSPSFPEVHPEQATHIIHTSGSTGPPKAVQVLEKGLLRLVENDHFTFQQDDRVAHLCAPSFDISLFEVWCTFLSGATLVIISPEVTRNPSALCSAFRRHQVSVAALPTALFNIVSRALPETFNSLRWVAFAGEAANLQAVKSVLEVAPATLSLFNCYGLTECSVFSLCYKVDPKHVQEDNGLPIGVAYDKATLFRVMDDSSREVTGPVVGELYIGGDSVARGYRNQPDITKQKFVVSDGIKWYRTGDQVQWRDGVVGGLLDYVGRLDNQVKLRGLRFELEEIDTAILGHGSVAACTTVLMKVAHAEPFLVAFIIVKDNIPPSAVEEGLLVHLRTILPAYMIPRLHHSAELPLTPNGKVDRQALSTSYLGTVIGPQTQPNLVSVNDPAALLNHIWQEVLAHLDGN